MDGENRIRVLDKITASRIAAGEVIDRTASVIRELMDNAIDAGADEISVFLTGGGIREIRVIDNGCGMSSEDLNICYLPHSTSKLRNADDLFNIMTMGFRGEALASIAASARLEITTSQDGQIGYGISIDGGKITDLGAVKANKGTVVTVRELFCYLPARRKFLKSPASETALCRNMFFEKALAFPGITFRLSIDGKMAAFLPAGTLKKRVADVYSFLAPEKMYHEVECQEENYSFHIIFPGTDIIRQDRKYIKIYVNRRCIQEFALVQAICYGLSAYFPGGTYPAAFLFLEIAPALVDFNIHPAKKEVKINILQTVHHSIVTALKKYMEQIQKPASENASIYPAPEAAPVFHFAEESVQHTGSGFSYQSTEASVLTQKMTAQKPTWNPSVSLSPDSALLRTKPEERAYAPDTGFRYLGQIFDSFLLCQRGNSLFIIDQHASQERFNFDSFLAEKPDVHQLLIPFYLDVEDEIKTMVEKNLTAYEQIGMIIKKDDAGELYIDSMPAVFFELKNDVLELLKTQTGDIENIKTELYARAACKKSVKAGDLIDHEKAVDLIEKVFAMKMPRCPHGRPLYYELTKEDLYLLMGRT
ncbi:MAG: DNA mismatch repair endonuclease MutL [Spirochaetia bacterium]|nr:DNA mismatch repair endonuclease MutL [Spirochaetia bacterium]